MSCKWFLLALTCLPLLGQSADKAKQTAPDQKKVEATDQSTQKVECPAFEVKLTIKNGHLGQVFLKTDPKGSDLYDRGLDDMAPPPGMQTGYTALVSPDMKHYLYRDTRKPAENLSWIFFAEVFKDKPVSISWNKKLLPEAYDFILEDANNNQTLDMRKSEAYTVDKKSAFYIKAKLKAKPTKEAESKVDSKPAATPKAK